MAEDCITTIRMRGNQVAKWNKCPDRLWDVLGASGAYKVTDRDTAIRVGKSKYDPKADIYIVFGNWCDEVMVEIYPRSIAFENFERGWKAAQNEIGAGTQLSLLD